MMNHMNFEKPSMDYTDFLSSMSADACEADAFDTSLYERYNVKRGLRNADSTGVLVGLTSIGEVRGYIIEENEKVPIDGRLLYRGIDVWKFVEGCQRDGRFGFEECSYLLLTGKLPTKEQLAIFNTYLDDHRRLPDGFAEDMIMKAPSNNIMNKLARCVLASYSYDDNADDMSFQNVLRQSLNLIAQFPTMVAYAYQARAHYYEGKSMYIHNPQKGLSTSENLLQMIRPDSKYTKLEAEILDLNLILHAEHGGGNNSSFTVHVVTSSGTDTYSAIAAAIGSLKGPKHGGANLKVIDMMEDIKTHVSDWTDSDEVRRYLLKIMNREAYDRTGLIYGMGHAVYTKSDPRAILLKRKAAELAAVCGCDKEFALYDLVEKLSPGVFDEIKHNSKEICANVDFYSGFVYSMLNIPKELYTPIFAISRIAGWCAHRMEELVAGNRIIRPAYKHVGTKHQYQDMADRK